MAVTYGYDMKKGDKFVTSMQRASDIFLRVGTPELSVLSSVFPLSELLPSNLVPLDHALTCVCCSEGIAGMAPGDGIQV